MAAAKPAGKPARKPHKKRAKLTAPNARQRLFIAQYLIDLDQTAAYIRAGYKAAGQVAMINACRLMAKPYIKAAIEEAMRKREQRIEVTADRVLLEVGRLAFFDMRKLYRADGTLKPPTEWDDDVAAALAGLEVIETRVGEADEEGNIRFVPQFIKKAKVWDKGNALTLAMRHLGMLKDKLEVNSKVTGAIEYIAEIPKRNVGG